VVESKGQFFADFFRTRLSNPPGGWTVNSAHFAAGAALLENPAASLDAPLRPVWLPAHLPELDGLRGLAVLGVFFFHARLRLAGSWLDRPTQCGWSGVSLFFVLSGFLITSILLTARQQPRHYFRNFYARRALRVWPVYFLLIAVCFCGPAWLLGAGLVGLSRGQTLAALLLFVQNILPVKLLGALEPTWSLAIEEQYYLLWAPIVRWLRRPWLLASGLATVLIASPFLRLYFGSTLNPTHTLFHLDSIALGSLLALGLLYLRCNRRTWLVIGLAAASIGFALAATVASSTVYADSALGLGFAGAVLAAIAGTGARNPLAWLLRRGPLPFYGKISYGLYMTHMAVIMSLGIFYNLIDRSAAAGSYTASYFVVAVQLTLSTAVATLLWHGFEKPILRLKNHLR
jgi:peptidoglycan/LPS O-acetylase OafA/YrhL